MLKPRLILAAKVAVVLGILILVLAFFLLDLSLEELKHYTGTAINTVLDVIRKAGPLGFFLGMALLPTFGVPISVFNLSVAPAFAETLGMPLLIACVALSLFVNLILCYVLIRYVLRPWAERLLKWLGYKIPDVPESAQLSVTVLLRVTPGPPYLVQNLILGLLAIPFRLYILISFPLVFTTSLLFIFFTDSIVDGNGGRIIAAVGLFIALIFALRLIRKYFQKRAEEKGVSPENTLPSSDKP